MTATAGEHHTAVSNQVNTVPSNLASHSRFVQRIRRRYERELPLLAAGEPSKTSMQACLDALLASGFDLGQALRVLRQLVVERLVVLDCEHGAALEVITRAITALAEFALEHAMALAMSELRERHGQPTGHSDDVRNAQPANMWVVGMGKLGARELNVSSDIDLIYVYDCDGETDGNERGLQRISNHEFFGKVVKRIYQLVGETTEHGFVFRVDLALRPNGSVGPAAVSLDALEEYFLIQGREWERFAWLKSRVVAPSHMIANGCAQALRDVVLPFVFRRYLDYNVFEGLRKLHRQIREHAAKRASGHPERANDVKLSRGGIREIEFTVQLLQVVRGGQFPELRKRPTLSALTRLTNAGLMETAKAQALARAYVFLRQVEHRTQYLDDQQTHQLPTQDSDLAWMAQTLGFADTCAFLCALDAHRETVAQEFDILLGGQGECTNCNKSVHDADDLESAIDELSGAFRTRIALWQTHPRVLALREDSRTRLARLIQRTGAWLESGRTSEVGALRLADWMEPMLRRDSYLALLQERPAVHERLLRLLAAAKWPARYLIQHPGVMDELANPSLLSERFDAVQFEAELEARRFALQTTGEDNDEELLNLLRRAHHSEVFRTLARDVEGVLSVEFVADDLSALADAVLRVTTRWCWQRLKNAHREEPALAIIAYGKLGGKELGYGSDLDIVFVYDDEHEAAPEAYAALVRKLINWLTVKTGEGDLFEIDTALRPNGNSGLLVTRMSAFADYQERRGSNTAWTWEHQAITRARCAVGTPALAQQFEAVRHAVMVAPRDANDLLVEITTMREKVREAHRVPSDMFDLKHSPGGMVDVEFVMQYVLLAKAHAHPQLLPNLGNIKLLRIAKECGLVPPGISDAAADAYRAMRQMQHRARLDEAPTQVLPSEVAAHRDAVLDLWRHVMQSH
jgi:[glutamine synthetase] adenylyltransferase / [glutamine synthetase]-adenylyl-L-tyrosine phosphorylase